MSASEKPIIYITDYVAEPNVERRLPASFGYDLRAGILSAEERKKVIGLLVWHEHINADYLRDFPNVKAVVRYGVGYDIIDVELLREKRIAFANTPDYGTDEVADTAVAMLLCGARGITQYQTTVTQLTDGSWQENTLPHLVRTKEMRLGVVGLGRIGSSVALKCRAIGFQVGFYDPNLPSGVEKSLSLTRYNTLGQLLEVSNAVTLHTPLNTQTAGMVDRDFLSAMPDGSILVNTARGGLLEDFGLIHMALDEGKLSFAGLDVIPDEPVSPSHKHYAPMIAHMASGRLVVNPHSAYFSQQAYVEMRELATRNLCHFLDGNSSLVNRIC